MVDPARLFGAEVAQERAGAECGLKGLEGAIALEPESAAAFIVLGFEEFLRIWRPGLDVEVSSPGPAPPPLEKPSLVRERNEEGVKFRAGVLAAVKTETNTLATVRINVKLSVREKAHFKEFSILDKTIDCDIDHLPSTLQPPHQRKHRAVFFIP